MSVTMLPPSSSEAVTTQTMAHLSKVIGQQLQIAVTELCTTTAEMQAIRGLPKNVNGFAEKMLASSGRMMLLLEQMLPGLETGNGTPPTVVDLNQTVAENQAVIEEIVGKDTACVFHCSASACPVQAVPSLLRQLVLSLSLRAASVLPAACYFSITTRRVGLAQLGPLILPGGDGDEYVRLAVSNSRVSGSLASCTGKRLASSADVPPSEPFLIPVLHLAEHCGAYAALDTTANGTTLAIYFPSFAWDEPLPDVVAFES